MDGATHAATRHRSVGRHHDSRRQSASTESSSKPAARRTSRLQGPGPASPEVLSSLITSLSAISAPAEDLYDSLIPNGSINPKSAPPTLSKTFLAHNVRDDIISEDPPQEIPLNLDEAAIPPVIRTSKHPSGYSPLTAPKKSIQPSVLFATSSINESVRARSSIGSISVEPRHHPSTTSLQSMSTFNSKSGNSLKAHASKEKMRAFDKERRRAPFAPEIRDPGMGSNENIASQIERTSSTYQNGTVGGPEIPSRVASWHAPSPKSSTRPGSPSPDSPSSPSKMPVPDRGSSLRHSFGGTPKPKSKTKARRDVNGMGLGIGRDEFSDIDTSPTKGKRKEELSNSDEDTVARRIEELKKQKELRRLSEQTIAEQARAEAAEWEERSVMASASASGNAQGGRSASVAAPGKENLWPGGKKPVSKSLRDPLMRAATEPIPADRAKSFDEIAPGRVSTSTNRILPSIADSIDESIEAYLANPRLSQKVKEPRSGRTIAFSEVGDPEGSVVFCCVGMGTTRYLMAFYDELATTLRLRLIAPDRPGIGESDSHVDGVDTPLGWPGKHNFQFVTSLC